MAKKRKAKKRKRKEGGGRKEDTGVRSSIDSQREEPTDIRARLFHGYQRNHSPMARLHTVRCIAWLNGS
jgi:hypothetical protein